MFELLLVLTPIALLDSTSVVPIAFVPLLSLMGGKRPLTGPAMFIAGTFVTYAAAGLLLVMGLDWLFKAMNEWFERVWNRPDTPDLMLQMVLGLLLIVLAMRIASARRRKNTETRADMGPGAAFMTGAGLVIVGLPGAVPYFAALDQILRADVGIGSGVLALGWYNLIVIAPLVAIVAVRSFMGEQGEVWLRRIDAVMQRWMPKVLIALFMVLGVLLVVDAVAWFQGSPIIPID